MVSPPKIVPSRSSLICSFKDLCLLINQTIHDGFSDEHTNGNVRMRDFV